MGRLLLCYECTVELGQVDTDLAEPDDKCFKCGKTLGLQVSEFRVVVQCAVCGHRLTVRDSRVTTIPVHLPPLGATTKPVCPDPPHHKRCPGSLQPIIHKEE